MPHPFRPLVFSLCLISTALSHLAEARPWKSTDGLRIVQGEFIKRDATSITIRLDSGKETRFEIAKLHADDQKWLATYHPTSGEPIPDESAVFDTLKFGDTHEVTLAKLKASKFVEMTIADNLLGRTGLNDVFRIRQKIGGLQASLYFDWNSDETLKEITVRTSTFPIESYDAKIAPCWQEFAELLTNLHGKPLQAIAKIPATSIPKGASISSHLWRLENGGSALLGIGNEAGNYQVVVRFTEEKIEPARPTTTAKPKGLEIDFDP
jgi:hypothetical protein